MPLSGRAAQKTSVDSLAVLTALPTPGLQDGEIAYVHDTKRYFYLDRNSADPVGDQAVDAQGGGQWLFFQDAGAASGDVYLSPLGGGQSDALRVRAAVDTVAASGGTLYMLAGTFKIDASIVLPKGKVTRINCKPQTVWNANIAGVLATDSMLIGETPSTVLADTLASDVVVGSDQIHVTAGPLTEGSYVQILPVGTVATTIYQVESYNAGTKIAKVDRPIERAYKAGDTVNELDAAPASMEFEGNWCTFSGVAVGWLFGNMINSWIQHVTGSDIGGAANDFYMIWITGLRCIGRHLQLDVGIPAPGTFNCGFGHIGSEDCGWEDVSAENCGSFASAFKYADAVNCWDTNSFGPNAGVGLFFGSDLAATSQSCVGCESIGGHFDLCNNAIVITGGSSFNVVDFLSANDATNDGVEINGGGATAANFATGNEIRSGEIKRAARWGLVTTDGSPRTKITDLDVEASVGDDVRIGDDADLVGLSVVGTSTTLGVRNIRVTGTANGRARFRDWSLDVTTAGGGNFSFVCEAGDVVVGDGYAAGSVNAILFSSAGATVSLESTVLKPKAGAGGTIGVYASGGRITVSLDCNITTATVISRAGGAIGGQFQGTGGPNLDASIGATYQRFDGGAGTAFYVNETAGAGGWVGK